jgi:hypothetical protein
MSDTDPRLLLHLPLDELRGEVLFDTTRQRRNATARGAAIVEDEEFGQCLELSGGAESHVILPPLKIEPLSHPPLTFLMWIKTEAPCNLFDLWFGPEIQRLQVHFSRDPTSLRFSVLMPTGISPVNGVNVAYRLNDPELVAQSRRWVHIAMVWDPRRAGSSGFYCNGRRPAAISATLAPVAPQPLGGLGDIQGYFGRPSFRGRLAQFRVYARALTEEEIRWDMAEDRPVRYRYRITHPLDFSLENRDGDPALYIDNHPDGQKMVLRVTPASRAELHLAQLTDHVPKPDNHHFELAFRPGTLAPGSVDKIRVAPPADGWESGFRNWTNPNDHDSLYLLRTVPGPLPASGMTLQLEHLLPDARYGTRTTLVDFRYRNIKSGSGETVIGSVEQNLDLITHLGRRNIPLHVGFVGSHQVLNNDENPQTLRLRITNILPDGTQTGTLRFDERSEFILSLDERTGAEWALNLPEKLGDIVVRYAKGQVTNSAPAAQRRGGTDGKPWSWAIPLKELTIAPEETLEVRLENVTASGSNGHSNLYVDYRNVPSYWDGRFVCVIDKTPLVYREAKVGIGTASPDVELDVKGTLRVDALKITSRPVLTPLMLSDGWKQELDNRSTPKWYKDALGVVHLTGHCFYVLPAAGDQRRSWLTRRQTLITLPPECANAVLQQFPGRVRLIPDIASTPYPEPTTTWYFLHVDSTNVCTTIGRVSDGVLQGMYAVEVYLDGISFPAGG